VDDLEASEPASWCEGAARRDCAHDAIDKAAQAERLAADKCDGYVLHARARVASGDVTGGLAELEGAADRVTDRVGCLQSLVALSRTVGNEASTQSAMDKIVNAGCSDSAECAQSLIWVAHEEQGRGNRRKALALLKRAYERTPENDGLVEEMGLTAAALGLHAEAAEDYERLERRHPEVERWRAASQAERDAALREAIKL
jgi:tetratricopeptide (TPR) repeat protein